MKQLNISKNKTSSDLPINRGVEIDSSVADGDQAIILGQVLNGVAIRMSILYLLLGPDEGLEN